MSPLARASLATAALLATLAASAFADPVAVIASVKGKVEVTTPRLKAPARAVFGRSLERGDRVSVGPGGSASLFFNDGNVIELSERSAITIGGRLASGPRAAALPGDVYTQVSRFVTTGSRQTGLVTIAGLRGDVVDSVPLLLEPRSTSILTDAPEFWWRRVPGATKYRVRVSAAGGAELWNREVEVLTGESGGERKYFFGAQSSFPIESLPYPADAPKLTGDTDIQWDLEALDAKGTLRRESTVVRVLSPTALGDVRANLAKISEGAGGADSPAARFLAGSYLSGLGVYQGAAEQFRALTALAPESPGPHEALGNVYLSVGLVDLAATEFQQALALQRDGR